jgi:hypothetical protein
MKLREKEQEFCKLFEEVREQVIGAKVYGEKCAETKKRKKIF